jgi:hypothetical protein
VATTLTAASSAVTPAKRHRVSRRDLEQLRRQRLCDRRGRSEAHDQADEDDRHALPEHRPPEVGRLGASASRTPISAVAG